MLVGSLAGIALLFSAEWSTADADKFDDAGKAIDLALRSCLAGTQFSISGDAGINLADILRKKAKAGASLVVVDVVDLIPGLGSKLKANEADKVRACMATERKNIFCELGIYCAPVPTPAAPTPEPTPEYLQPRWENARNNIHWVLVRDEGAKRTYNKARNSGLGKFHSVLAAQAHNRASQDSIVSMGEGLATEYIKSLGF